MISGPRRTTIQRQRSGPAAVIGAPPAIRRPTPFALAQKRAATPFVSSSAARTAGPMKKRPSKREITASRRNGNGSARAMAPGAATYEASSASWYQNPWIWAAAIGLFYFSRRKK